jgi:hypothetical protein
VLGASVLVVIAVVVLIVVLAGGGSTPPSGFRAANPGKTTKVSGANTTALRQIDAYNSAVQNCGTNIVCVEKADRTLGTRFTSMPTTSVP